LPAGGAAGAAAPPPLLVAVGCWVSGAAGVGVALALVGSATAAASAFAWGSEGSESSTDAAACPIFGGRFELDNAEPARATKMRSVTTPKIGANRFDAKGMIVKAPKNT
jgi:hypothetical protein